MKKTYIEPQVIIVEIQQTKPLATSINDGVKGNAGFIYRGGSQGDTEGRVKEDNGWDDWGEE